MPRACRLKRRWLDSLLGLALWLLAAAGASADYVASREFFSDPTGKLSIAQVQSQAFVPAPEILARGYTSAATWVRLNITPRQGDDGRLIFRIRPTYLDDVRLYVPDSRVPGGWRESATGDRYPFAEREVAGLALRFEEAFKTPTQVYLRLQTTSNSLLKVEVISPKEAYQRDAALNFVYWIYFSAMALVLVLLLYLGRYLGDAAVGWFALSHLAFMIYSVSMMGFLPPLFPVAAWLGDFTSICVFSVFLGPAIYHRQFFRAQGVRRRWLIFLDGLLVASVVAILLWVLGHERAGLALNAKLALLFGPVVTVLAFLVDKNTHDPQEVTATRVIYCLLTLSLLVAISPHLGLIPASEWSLHGTLAHGLISASLISYLVHRRFERERRQGLQDREQLIASRQEAMLREQQLKERADLMAMLTHELKTPLSLVKLTVDTVDMEAARKERIDRAVTDMSRLIDRCRDAGEFEKGSLIPRPLRVRLLDELQRAIEVSRNPDRITLLGGDVLGELLIDPQLLQLVLGNLLENALRYSPAGSVVTCAVTAEKRRGTPGVLICIVNTVQGAAPMADRVFDKYYRGDAARGVSGSGLGLYIAKSVVELLGGQIGCEIADSTIEFCLWLPQ